MSNIKRDIWVAGIAISQEKFIEEYLKSHNVTDAYVAAGFPGKEDNDLKRMLPIVQAAIQNAYKTREGKDKVTKKRITEEIAKIAFSDLRDFITWNVGSGVRVKNSVDVAPNAAACIQDITVKVGGNGSSVSIKLWNKLAALELLAKVNGLLVDKIDVKGDIKHEHFGYGDYTPEQLRAEAAKLAMELEMVANVNSNGNGKGKGTIPAGNGHKKRAGTEKSP